MIESLVNEWLSVEDVFRPEFLQGIVTVTGDEGTHLATADLPPSLGAEWTSCISQKADTADVLTPGPYVLWKNELCKAFRLYDDVQLSFVAAIKPLMLHV